MLLPIITAFLATMLVASGLANAQVPANEAAPSVRLTGNEVTVLLVLVDGYPFIKGEVNGVKGKFMFDTGADAALSLNDYYIPLKGGTNIGGNKVASGQTFPSQLNKTIASVKFAQFSYIDVHNVESSDAAQIQRDITPDFLGWIGFEFFRGYAIKIDYQKKQVTFYKDGPAAATRFMHGETVVAVIPFQQHKLARIPIVEVTLGKTGFDSNFDTVFDGNFDTGSQGSLLTDKATRKKLAAEGVLAKAKGKDGVDQVDLTGIDVGYGAAHLDLRFAVSSGPFPPAEAIGVHPNNDITFGYNLLSKYKTVWDYANHKIYLLKYGSG
jgi:hypothetical protein